MYYPEEKKHPELRIFAMFLYVIAAFSAIFQLYQSTVIWGMLLLAVSWFMNKAQKATTRETFYASHAEWTSLTLSRGTFLVFPLCFAIGAWLVWKNTDIESVRTAMNSDDPEAALKAIQSYISRSTPVMFKTSVQAMIPAVVWWVWRCASGFLKAKDGLPVDYPGSWV